MVWRGVKDVCKELYATFNDRYCSEKAALVLNLGSSVPQTRVRCGHQGPTLLGRVPTGWAFFGSQERPPSPLGQERASLRVECRPSSLGGCVFLLAVPSPTASP